MNPALLDAQGQQSLAYFDELNLTFKTTGQLNSSLDPLPLILTQGDQDFLRAAVDQFGQLLTASYFDLLGPQSLVDEGLVPAELIWARSGADPAYFQALGTDQFPLSVIRVDVSLRQDGRWSLVSLGTEAPRGLGFALENRIVHSRFFGQLVPQDNLIRLAPFFQGLKDLWFHESRSHQDDPTVMVWTLGPSDPGYFEPVYLARYFGYPLVESRDLTVRSGKVFLKTLGGLQAADVLLRWVSDRALDPLAGNPPGFGGVGGLMQAVRDRSVVVTNAPGAAVLEHPGFLPLWPSLCRRLLGSPLLLDQNAESVPPALLDFRRGSFWYSQPATVSLFAARTPQGWNLMPGGLVKGTDGTPKDLWFLSSGNVEPASLLPARERPTEVTHASELASRVADDLYWLGRYVERAWNDLRYLEKWWDIGSSNPSGPGVNRLLSALMDDLEILSTEDQLNRGPGRLAETLVEIQRLSNQVLDRLSLETHQLLKELGAFSLSEAGVTMPDALRRLGLRLAAFHGLTMENMTRTPGWIFLDLGRRLERSELLLESLASFFRQETTEENLSLLLELFDSILTYRSRYRLSPQTSPVLDLLLLDETNPRSLAFQLVATDLHIAKLPRPDTRAYRSLEERTILDLLTHVRLCDAGALTGEALETFLTVLAQGLETLGQALHQTYLAKIEPSEVVQARQKQAKP